jgi:hypothetical protein
MLLLYELAGCDLILDLLMAATLDVILLDKTLLYLGVE